MIKDLIISGDQTIHAALDQYENGNVKDIQDKIQSGFLHQRSIDVLEGLDLDFFTVGVDDNASINADIGLDDDAFNNKRDLPMLCDDINNNIRRGSIDSVGSIGLNDFSNVFTDALGNTTGNNIGMKGKFSQQNHNFYGINFPENNLINGSSDLDFNNQWVHDRKFSLDNTFTDLLDLSVYANVGEILQLQKKATRRQPSSNKSNKNASAGASTTATTIATATIKKSKGSGNNSNTTNKAMNKHNNEATNSSKSSKDLATQSVALPLNQNTYNQRSSDSNHLSNGYMNSIEGPTVYSHCINPQSEKGFIGAYSPEARRLRIDRFFEKRSKRVWNKKVKYDVRKNFADSRIRVKGRFVKKEDEELMQNLRLLE